MTAETISTAELGGDHDLGSVRKSRVDRHLGLYGLIDEEQTRLIMPTLISPVLDIGTGPGFWLEPLRRQGCRIVGLDLDESSLIEGRRLSAAPRVMACGEELPFCRGAFWTFVFRKSAHHLDLAAVLDEADKLGVRRLVFFEPNSACFLRLLHRLISFHDETLSLDTCLCLLKKRGWKVTSLDFSQLFALPISGGWIAPWSLPRLGNFGAALIILDRAISRILPLFIARRVCLRWHLVVDRQIVS